MKPSKFQFVNPYLAEVHFTVNADFPSDIENSEIEMQNKFNVQVKRNPEKNMANVSLELEINAENIKAPFGLQIRVASDFMWNDLDDTVVTTMLNQNAPALLLSYMRPIVANITNSSKFPAYNLPFVNFRE